MRITAQLVDAATGGHLWSERYDRGLSDIFALQAEIADEVVGQVGGEIRETERRRLARKSTTSLTAYEAYQQGMSHLFLPSRQDNERARALLVRAVETDPGFAAAHAALGVTYFAEYAFGWDRAPALLDRAEELARRAIALDPSYFQGYGVAGWVAFSRGDVDEALATAERAIELGPNYELPHALRGLALARRGELLEATRSVRRALRLNPRAPTPSVLISLAYVNWAAGRRQEAKQFLEQARTAVPEAIPGRVGLAVFYEQEGAHEKARAEVAEMLRVRPDLTAESAMELIPGLERLVSAEEFAGYPDHLRAAGLP